jgi:phosphatidylinositol alpha-1,6-mannosyltransferase
VTSLLVTNDFPPKIGGIQSYLWELWRRLPASETTVLTTPYSGDRVWDAQQAFRVERRRETVLWPTAGLARDVDALAREVGADVIFVDPALPLGRIVGRLRAAPVMVVLHGAEITVPGRLPSRGLLAGVLRAADVFAMLCRDRWGGLEAEGFGIVFLEAGASGLACIAGRSGGSHEAVAEGLTGFVVEPRDVDGVASRLRRLLDDVDLRARLGAAARTRAEAEWSYDRRVEPLARLAAGDLSVLR